MRTFRGDPTNGNARERVAVLLLTLLIVGLVTAALYVGVRP